MPLLFQNQILGLNWVSYPWNQFTPDTTCLRLVWTPQVKNSVLQDYSHLRCSPSRSRQVTYISVWLSYNLGNSHNSLRFSDLLEWLRKMLWFHYSFITKDNNSGTAKWRRCIGQRKELPCPFQVLHPPKHWYVLQVRSSLTPWTTIFKRVFLFCFFLFLLFFLHSHGWLNDWPLLVELNYPPLFFPHIIVIIIIQQPQVKSVRYLVKKKFL